ncbi:MAG: CarD family transcriptional regulator [Deltaproteobacteria bacterium]
MFKVNDYIVYGLTGVCQVVDITKGDNADNCRTEYYVLQPVYSDNITIKVPVNNSSILMRAVCSKEDIMSMIAMMPGIQTIWIDNEKQRMNDYKAALKTGKIEEWVKIIKTLYLEREARSVDGRKLRKTDEDILCTAQKYLNEEFAIALNIGPDEVPDYILRHIV